MVITTLSVDDTLRETIELSNKAFPHAVLFTSLMNYHEKYVSWHWHPEVEFHWILRGTVEISTSNRTYKLEAGDGAFINSNVLHTLRPATGELPTSLTQLFDVRLISGGPGSLIWQKYVRPVIENKNIEMVAFHPDKTNQRAILDLLRSSYDIAEKEDYGYEIQVRNSLSSAWLFMCKELEENLTVSRISRKHDEERIKSMLLYIRENYTRKIELEEIAAAANISTRECLRCFRSSLDTTPFTYLLDYRIHAASRLLRETDKSVTEIAYETGFSTVSYFSKKFRSIMSCTPLEYRKEADSAQKALTALPTAPQTG
ncbi:MAG: helix-turn-helix domain-containing protein [Lachnospiraceae bacterium]